MTTAVQEFLASVRHHLINAGFHAPQPNHSCPKCSVLLCSEEDMPSAVLNAIRVGVAVVRLRSINQLRSNILHVEREVQYGPRPGQSPLDVDGVLDVLNNQLSNGYGEMAAIGREDEFLLSADKLLGPLHSGGGDGDADAVCDGDARPAPEPPTERGRVGSGIYFPDDLVKGMIKCDCAECPNGCRACQPTKKG